MNDPPTQSERHKSHNNPSERSNDAKNSPERIHGNTIPKRDSATDAKETIQASSPSGNDDQSDKDGPSRTADQSDIDDPTDSDSPTDRSAETPEQSGKTKIQKSFLLALTNIIHKGVGNRNH